MQEQTSAMFDEVMAQCARGSFTGLLRVRTREGNGEVRFLSGIQDGVKFGAIEGDAALARLQAAGDADFEAISSLPAIDGSAQPLPPEGRLEDFHAAQLMRYCESNSLTCALEIEVDNQVLTARYRLGELLSVEPDSELTAQMAEAKQGAYRFRLPRFELPANVKRSQPAPRDVAKPAPMPAARPAAPLGASAATPAAPAVSVAKPAPVAPAAAKPASAAASSSAAVKPVAPAAAKPAAATPAAPAVQPAAKPAAATPVPPASTKAAPSPAGGKIAPAAVIPTGMKVVAPAKEAPAAEPARPKEAARAAATAAGASAPGSTEKRAEPAMQAGASPIPAPPSSSSKPRPAEAGASPAPAPALKDLMRDAVPPPAQATPVELAPTTPSVSARPKSAGETGVRTSKPAKGSSKGVWLVLLLLIVAALVWAVATGRVPLDV